MSKVHHYLAADPTLDNPIVTIIDALDRDVAHGEDLLMLGLGIVMLSSTFAPVAPPSVILPLVALTFAISSGLARRNYHAMQHKLNTTMAQLSYAEQATLQPIMQVFKQHPMPPLIDSYNVFNHLARTWKSVLGGILINPFWMPIFYVMGIQISEEKNLILLNHAIIAVEQQHLKRF
jgi:hypothetical protein